MNWPSIIGIAVWALLPGFIAKRKGRNFWAYYFLSFIITPLVTAIITICLSKKTEDASASESATATIEQTRMTAPPAESEQSVIAFPEVTSDVALRTIMYCRRCGNKLIEGSEFCSSCGTQIIKDGEQ